MVASPLYPPPLVELVLMSPTDTQPHHTVPHFCLHHRTLLRRHTSRSKAWCLSCSFFLTPQGSSRAALLVTNCHSFPSPENALTSPSFLSLIFIFAESRIELTVLFFFSTQKILSSSFWPPWFLMRNAPSFELFFLQVRCHSLTAFKIISSSFFKK